MTGIAGKPEEYFVPGYRDDILRNIQLGNLSSEKYFERFVRASITPNGVLGVKLHAVQTSYLLERIQEYARTPVATLYTGIEMAFPGTQYIYLQRGNKVAQAVSYYKAIMSNEWWRFENSVQPQGDQTIPYSQYGIKKALRLVEFSDRYWKQYFEKYAIKPLVLTFEDLVDDYSGSLERTLEYLGLQHDNSPREPQTVRQSNEQSAAWASRFLEDEQRNPAEPFTKERGAPQ